MFLIFEIRRIFYSRNRVFDKLSEFDVVNALQLRISFGLLNVFESSVTDEFFCTRKFWKDRLAYEHLSLVSVKSFFYFCLKYNSIRFFSLAWTNDFLFEDFSFSIFIFCVLWTVTTTQICTCPKKSIEIKIQYKNSVSVLCHLHKPNLWKHRWTIIFDNSKEIIPMSLLITMLAFEWVTSVRSCLTISFYTWGKCMHVLTEFKGDIWLTNDNFSEYLHLFVYHCKLDLIIL